MLLGLKLPPLQHRRLESRLVMLYNIVSGMVPTINYQDWQTSNFVDKYTLECYKVRQSNSEQFRIFVCENYQWFELFNRHSHTCRA